MGNHKRIRVNLIRKRFNSRHAKVTKSIIIVSILVIILFAAVTLKLNTNNSRTFIVDNDGEVVNAIASNENVDIYNVDVYSEEEVVVEEELVVDNKQYDGINGEIKFTILGQMMMGGEVTTNLNYKYNSAFKEVFTLTRFSDFTYTTFANNITNLDKIENARSKHLVTRDIIGGVRALGVNIVNVASNRMCDFPQEIFDNTINTLKGNDVEVAGLDDEILYLEKGDKKIAVIAANNVFIGTKRKYTNYGINVYAENKLKEDILSAKENADFIIVDIHWGREHKTGVTREMRKIAHTAIDNGADFVIGSNALGIYPVTMYKNVPIIYSTGYIMTDSDNELAKTSYIFDLIIGKDNKPRFLEMTPIYIKDKEIVLPYYDHDKEMSDEIINQMNELNEGNNIDSRIIDDKIVIIF